MDFVFCTVSSPEKEILPHLLGVLMTCRRAFKNWEANAAAAMAVGVFGEAAAWPMTEFWLDLGYSATNTQFEWAQDGANALSVYNAFLNPPTVGPGMLVR